MHSAYLIHLLCSQFESQLLYGQIFEEKHFAEFIKCNSIFSIFYSFQFYENSSLASFFTKLVSIILGRISMGKTALFG